VLHAVRRTYAGLRVVVRGHPEGERSVSRGLESFRDVVGSEDGFVVAQPE
jgi:hypothetical protein